MDDDDLRRGQPTLHCAFDEATAILAGDGLQAAAFQRITEIEALSAEQRLEILKVVSIAVGFQGMVGGQALDLGLGGRPGDECGGCEKDAEQSVHARAYPCDGSGSSRPLTTPDLFLHFIRING